MAGHESCSSALLLPVLPRRGYRDDRQLRSEINLNKLQGLLVPYNGIHRLGARPFWNFEVAFIAIISKIISATTVIELHTGILNL